MEGGTASAPETVNRVRLKIVEVLPNFLISSLLSLIAVDIRT